MLSRPVVIIGSYRCSRLFSIVGEEIVHLIKYAFIIRFSKRAVMIPIGIASLGYFIGRKRPRHGPATIDVPHSTGPRTIAYSLAKRLLRAVDIKIQIGQGV